MNNKTTNKPPFKVKCTYTVTTYLTVGKEYDVVEVEDGFYKIKNDNGEFKWYYNNRFEILDRESNPNWKRDWWFSKDDVSLVADNNPLNDKSQDYHILSHQEVIQAVIDGKELEMQYKTGKWANVIPMKTTLHQLANLNFRLKPSLEDKRKAVIKKLLTTKVAVLCKCWDSDVAISNVIVAITKIDDDYAYPYMNNCLAYEYAYAIDDNGNEITNV